MPPLRKPALLGLFEGALQQSGFTFLKISGPHEHPATYQILQDSASFRLKVYIWNLTFGGRASLPDEWRIQVTGLPEISGHQSFLPQVGGNTAILGWCDQFGVFAAYDVSKHLGPLGGSPSIQIREPALIAARLNGLSHHFRGASEVAFGVKPAYMGTYLTRMEDLHACGTSDEALSLLEELFQDPRSVVDKDINEKIPEPRRFSVVAARKALRDASFKQRVLTAYSNKCAMCGLQLRLLDAAHILPAAHPDSNDDTSNGIALCALHHRAYDQGFVTFDRSYRIHRKAAVEQDLRRLGLDGGLSDFVVRLFPVIDVPPDKKDRPDASLVDLVNSMRGWTV